MDAYLFVFVCFVMCGCGFVGLEKCGCVVGCFCLFSGVSMCICLFWFVL